MSTGWRALDAQLARAVRVRERWPLHRAGDARSAGGAGADTVFGEANAHKATVDDLLHIRSSILTTLV